mmetsp:Transcript_16980/g.41732  ORF Transcript_16980/g.41732 Transcript_16980/m.41732 type:complete len:82 (+) Transcript_16980:3-248(+)
MLKMAGAAAGQEAGFEWDAGKQVKQAFWVETDGGKKFRERPADLVVNPVTAYLDRKGTTMPDEWAEANNPGYNPDVPRGSR